MSRLITSSKFVRYTPLLEKDYKTSFENKLCVINNENKLKIFKIHTKDKFSFRFDERIYM